MACNTVIKQIYWIKVNYRSQRRVRARLQSLPGFIFVHAWVKHWWDIKVIITNGKIDRATAEVAAHRDLLAVLHISYDPPSNDDYGCIKTPSDRLPIMGICTPLIYVFYSLVGNSAITERLRQCGVHYGYKTFNGFSDFSWSYARYRGSEPK